MPGRFDEGLAILEKHKGELALPDDAAKTKYVTDFRKAVEWLNERQPEDLRLAATMAIDSSKSLLSIAVAVFIAIGGFIQYGITHDLEWRSPTILLFGLAEAFVVLSMLFGFNVIGKAFKRGEGREAKDELAWSTLALRPLLHLQSYAGLAALLAFGGALLLWRPASQGTFTVTPVAATATPGQAAGKSLVVEGEWSSLVLRQGALSLSLAPVPAGQTSAFKIDTR